MAATSLATWLSLRNRRLAQNTGATSTLLAALSWTRGQSQPLWQTWRRPARAGHLLASVTRVASRRVRADGKGGREANGLWCWQARIRRDCPAIAIRGY